MVSSEIEVAEVNSGRPSGPISRDLSFSSSLRARARRSLLSVSAALAPAAAVSCLMPGLKLGFFWCMLVAKVLEEEDLECANIAAGIRISPVVEWDFAAAAADRSIDRSISSGFWSSRVLAGEYFSSVDAFDEIGKFEKTMRVFLS